MPGTSAASGAGGQSATHGASGTTSASGTGGTNPTTGSSGSEAAAGTSAVTGTGTGGGQGAAASTATSSGNGVTSGASSSAGSTASSTSTGATPDAGGPTSAPLIVNDRFWKDTSGTPIYSQGGGVLLVGDTYYWYGVKYAGAVTYAANPTKLNSDTTFVSVTAYSSKDLVSWKFENDVVTADMTGGGWFGRLGVAYNATSKKYVLVAQGTSPAGVAGEYFATSATPTGKFTFATVQDNLTFIANGATGDQTLFQDDDGRAYVICSSAMGRGNLYVAPLRAADFLAVASATRIFGGVGREGNAMFKHAGTYYFCSSDLHGWNASHTYCISAQNIAGPYGAEFVLDGTDADFSHVTQTGFFIDVNGSKESTVIFAGDRWSDFAGNGLGFNQWMPLTFTGTTPHFQSPTVWSIDAATGEWSVGPGNNYVLNPSFEADRVAVTTPAGWTATGGSNVNDAHTGRWSWQVTGGGSLDQKLASLPNGTYTLSAWIKSTAAGAQLYAKGFGGTDKSVALPASTTRTNVSLSGIAVSNGQCDVGITSSGSTVTADDFVLTKN